MAHHASWKGYLKLSLVSCPVALYPATTMSEKVSFHFLNKETGHRLKQQYVDAESGDLVERDGRVRGFEIGKGDYVMVEDDELDHVAIESSHTIDIDSFVPRAEIDPVYFDASYYLVPDDKVGAEAFGVIRAAMDARGMAGMARIVLYGRERIVLLEPRNKGILATALHYAYEIRDDAVLFDDIPSAAPSADLLDLASHIIDTKRGHFQPSGFKDRYQEAVLALVRAKRKGKPAPVPSRADAGDNVINLADALRRSLGEAGGRSAGKRTSAKPGKATPRKSTARGSAAKSEKQRTSNRKAS